MPPAPARLPPLREDLALMPGPVEDGVPTWTVHDPSSHRFVRLGWEEMEILEHWKAGDAEAVAAAVRCSTTLKTTAADVAGFTVFLERARLLQPVTPADTARLVGMAEAARHGPWTWLLHNYLFLRIRLVRPDAFLEAALPLVRWMFTRAAAFALAGTAALAFLLVARQWDAYRNGLVDLFSFEGAASVAGALYVSKVVHELGHGFAAKRAGCRVPAMGVAFLVLVPVLWTDTAEAWKLTRRADRLLIDAAGMLAEITLAIAATLLWCVLPDGALRGAVLTLSGSTWVLTLAVNLSPLMRFDGYYILSDLLGVANLQERGFALARWNLRRVLLGTSNPPPEAMGRRLPAVLLYAYATWVYRFFLFMGIAFLVYRIPFKALGFVLMGVEVWFFLARPILSEIVAMAATAARTGVNIRSAATGMALAVLLGIALLPLDASLTMPAVMSAAGEFSLRAPDAGRIAEIAPSGYPVKAGDVILRLVSDDAAHDTAVARARFAAATAEGSGIEFDAERSGSMRSAAEEARRAAADLSAAEAREASLTVRAPFDAVQTDVPPGAVVASWVARHEGLGTLAGGPARMDAYLGEEDLPRVGVGASGVFRSDDGAVKARVRVTALGALPSGVVDIPELASTAGGPVPVTRRGAGEGERVPVPKAAVYRVRLDATGLGAPAHRLRGRVTLAAGRESLGGRVWHRMVAVVVREAGL